MSRLRIFLALVLICTAPCFADEANVVQLARSMVEAINDRDLDRLDDLVAGNVIRHSAATAGVTITNLEAFKAFLRTDFAAVPDSEISIEVIFGNKEYVAMRAMYSGIQTGAMGPFPPSGNKVELPFVGILRVAEGKISEMWVEWDNVYMLTQLGHMRSMTEIAE